MTYKKEVKFFVTSQLETGESYSLHYEKQFLPIVVVTVEVTVAPLSLQRKLQKSINFKS